MQYLEVESVELGLDQVVERVSCMDYLSVMTVCSAEVRPGQNELHGGSTVDFLFDTLQQVGLLDMNAE
jgi:hypothetical protein